MNEQGASSVVWREALAIIRRYPTATLVPAAMLGGLAQAPAYFIEGRPILDRMVTYLTAGFAYYLYLAYAEEIVTEAERKGNRITLPDVLRELHQAIPLSPRVLVAASISFLVSSFAAILLVLPGAWLFTRWSLSTPVVSKEDLGSIAALKRSNEIVRRRFWSVFETATLAFILEEAEVYGSMDRTLSHGLRHMGRLDRRFNPCSADHAVGCLHYFASVCTPRSAHATVT